MCSVIQILKLIGSNYRSGLVNRNKFRQYFMPLAYKMYHMHINLNCNYLFFIYHFYISNSLNIARNSFILHFCNKEYFDFRFKHSITFDVKLNLNYLFEIFKIKSFLV